MINLVGACNAHRQRPVPFATSLTPADGDTQIFKLWNVYRKHFGEDMSFDDFCTWGEVIINDFNDIDLYMADAASYTATFRPEGD
ncbi:MAG: hypothetical protein R2758_15890 [Bacteroidales bacterium]